MKLSDYLARFLVEQGVKTTFGITGGAVAHIFDSIGQNRGLEHICNHHEQASAMAADGYARISGEVGVGIATSGPGATNLLTGVCCSYYDSTPTVFITGQVPRSQLMGKSKVRQIGFQETDIVGIFKPVTKYASLVDSPEKIRYDLEKAFYLAKNGRPGPTLLDIPDDIQRADIDPSKLVPYSPEKAHRNLRPLADKVNSALELMARAERPIIILGSGVRLSGTYSSARKFIESTGFPVALTWGALDLFPDDYPLSVRDFGVTANRPGNFAVQNSDLVIALGTRLDTHETGSDLKTFARGAKRIVVDIDPEELAKYEERGFNVDVPINTDLNEFFRMANPLIKKTKKDLSGWLERIAHWKKKYPICRPEYYTDEEQINPYVFLQALSRETSEGDIIIPEAGCNVTWTMQGFPLKENQRMFTAFNHSPMGYGIPAAIGACFANGRKRVITVVGDGGFMMNEQELATIRKHNLPIKIFVMNNRGYGMIKQTQETWLGSRYMASSEDSFYLPDIPGLARAHGVERTESVLDIRELEKKIRGTLNYEGPALCDIGIHPDARIYPKLAFGRPIEDSSPLLEREEFLENMRGKNEHRS